MPGPSTWPERVCRFRIRQYPAFPNSRLPSATAGPSVGAMQASPSMPDVVYREPTSSGVVHMRQVQMLQKLMAVTPPQSFDERDECFDDQSRGRTRFRGKRGQKRGREAMDEEGREGYSQSQDIQRRRLDLSATRQPVLRIPSPTRAAVASAAQALYGGRHNL